METLQGFVGWAFLTALYLAPTIVAHVRKHRQFASILAVNVLTGWLCGIGWVVALVWAVSAAQQPATGDPA